MVAIIFETSCQSLPRPRSIEARQQIPPIHVSSLGNRSYEYTPYAPVPPAQTVRAAVSFVPLQDVLAVGQLDPPTSVCIVFEAKFLFNAPVHFYLL